MALFKVNTGTREQEVCGLQWGHEVKVPELDTSVFLIPGEHVKNGEKRLVVLNRVARSVIESLRGRHLEFVLKHTFGRRLRAAGVSFEDRQDLLGHKSGRITTQYSRGTLEPDRGCREGLRVRLPQISRNLLASAQGGWLSARRSCVLSGT
jgi:integrase